MRGKPLVLPIVAVVVAILPLIMPTDYHRQLLNQAMIYIILVVGYNFVTGDVGQLSMAQTGFFAIGAYTSALLAVKTQCPIWLALPSSAIVSGIFGAIVGIPTLKIRGHYLVMVTMAFSEMIRLVLTNWVSLTGGASGVSKIPTPAFGPLVLGTKTSLYYLLLVTTVVMVLVASQVRRTKYGRAFLAIRDGELAADVMGLNTTHVKVVAFALSAVFAGVAGSLYAYSFAYISPETFGLGQTIIILAMLLVGGVGSISGGVTGAILLTYLPEWLRFVQQYYMFAFGAGILLITLFMPYGIVGAATRLYQWLGRKNLTAKSGNL